MTTEEFVPFWSEGTDSFSKDPPNATLSIFGEGEPTNVVVTISNPVLDGDDLTYDIAILEGTPPPEGGESSLFIDIIGMPLTPLSYAGVARRTAWRGAYYAGAGAAVAGAAAAGAAAAAYYHPYYHPYAPYYRPPCGYYPYPPCY